MSVELRPGERLDDLQCGGLKLIQRREVFRFGTDSVLLADFASPKKKDRAVDPGCGTGAIALLMAGHQPSLRVDAVEIQPEIADMAARSVEVNGLGDRVRVLNADMRDAWRTLGAGAFRWRCAIPPMAGRARRWRAKTTPAASPATRAT